MSDQTGYRLVIANFFDETTTRKAVNRLLGEFRNERAAMPAAALVTKDAAGRLTIRETADAGAKQGAAAGALVGGLVGLLSRKRGALGTAALGALLGGAVAHKLDTGIPDPRLKAIGETLHASQGAAVAIVSDVAYDRAMALLAELQARVESEPFALETDFMKQLQAGDYSGAAATLASQAEGALTGATTLAAEKAEALSGEARRMRDEQRDPAEMADDMVFDDQPLTLTDEEEIEMTIGPSVAATMTGAATQATPGVPVRPDDTMKRVPDETPAEVAGADAVPDDDAGGTARQDIDPPGAGLPDFRPPAI